MNVRILLCICCGVFLLCIMTGCPVKPHIDVPETLTLTESGFRLPYHFPVRNEFGDLSNGEYYGEIHSGFDDGKIKIVIQNNNVIDVEIVDVLITDYIMNKGLGEQVLTLTPPRFLEAQSPQIDAVTGASGSVHVLKICFTRALWNAAGKEDPMYEFIPDKYK